MSVSVSVFISVSGNSMLDTESIVLILYLCYTTASI